MTAPEPTPPSQEADGGDVIVPRRWRKLLELAGLAVVVGGVGLGFIFVVAGETDPRFRPHPLVVQGVGWMLVVASGPILFEALRGCLDPRPGFAVGRDGFAIRRPWLVVGKVPWSQVLHLTPIEMNKRRYLAVYVREPERLLRRGTPLQRLLLKSLYRAHGTPLVFSVYALQIEFSRMESLLRTACARWQREPDPLAQAPPKPDSEPRWLR